ncbi:MAG: hypothetical protein K6U80_04400 [Firmicutes bacterium]|nr:hypothetical protein [Bacillota bacterium]
MIVDELFITPFIREFQSRIAPWITYEDALGAVIWELREVKEVHSTANGKAYYARTNGDWKFRVVIREGKLKSGVITILRRVKGKGGGSGPGQNWR